MASVYRFRVGLSGWVGGPGVNTWFATSGDGSVLDPAGLDEFWAKVRAFYDSVDAYLVGNYTMTFDGGYDELDVASGDLLSKGAVSTLTPLVTGASTSATSRATMLKLQCTTATISNNRVVKGGIYLGPISDDAIAGDGSVLGVARSIIVTAATAVYAASPAAKWAIWSQPKEIDGETRPGVVGAVNNVSIGTRPAVLRSRRD